MKKARRKRVTRWACLITCAHTQWRSNDVRQFALHACCWAAICGKDEARQQTLITPGADRRPLCSTCCHPLLFTAASPHRKSNRSRWTVCGQSSSKPAYLVLLTIGFNVQGFRSGDVNKTYEIYRQKAEDFVAVMPTKFMSTWFLLNSVSSEWAGRRQFSWKKKKTFLDANVVLSVYNGTKESQILTWLRNFPLQKLLNSELNLKVFPSLEQSMSSTLCGRLFFSFLLLPLELSISLWQG